MSPEEKARLEIDRKLESAGWQVVDRFGNEGVQKRERCSVDATLNKGRRSVDVTPNKGDVTPNIGYFIQSAKHESISEI